MSTLNTRKIKHDSSSVDNIALDANGRVGIGVSDLSASGANANFAVAGTVVNYDDDLTIAWGGGVGRPGIRGNKSTQSLKFFAGNAERLGIDSAGRVTMPYQPAFSAILTNGATATTNSVIPCNTVSYNIGNHYNPSTYTFTAPISARYFLAFTVRYNGYSSGIYLHPRLNLNNGSLAISHQIVSTTSGAGYFSMSWSGVVNLSANDAIALFDASQSGVTLGQYQNDQTGFSGILLG